jgi:hypothetical protein
MEAKDHWVSALERGLGEWSADPGKKGWTPLHDAAGYVSGECFSILLEAGADIHAKDRAGQTSCDVYPKVKPIVLDFLRKRLFRERIIPLVMGQKDEDCLFRRLPIELIWKITRHSLDGDPTVEEFEERGTNRHKKSPAGRPTIDSSVSAK